VLKKLRLDQTNKYELAIATNLIAQMLVNFILDREHSRSVGSEQGDIVKWDDFVIEKFDQSIEQIQVKRQHTDFSKDECIRGVISQGDNIGKPIKLSPFDESMYILAKWVKHNDPSISSPKRIFLFQVPDNTILIKNGLPLGKFHDLCHVEITPSTTVQKLELLAKSDNRTKKIFEWLTTWCGFSDWDHILRALRVLEIRQSANENDLDAQTEQILRECFNDTVKVRKSILSFIDENTSFTSAITPRPLLEALQVYLLPGVSTWTKYQNKGNNWEISGTHDTSYVTIESPKYVVPALWNSERKSELKFNAPIQTSSTTLSQAIIRLVLHLQNITAAQIFNLEVWREAAKNQIGNTLGVGENDFDSLNVIGVPDSNALSDSRRLTLVENNKEALSLSTEMYKITWIKICEYLERKIQGMAETELRNALDTRWRLWRNSFENNEAQQLEVCKSMLHPNAEGDDIISELRVGPKTSHLIANGIYLLLIVSVVFNENDNGWETFGEDLTVQTLALVYWSGTPGKRKTRKLVEDGISDLLGKESSKILILSEVESSRSDVIDATIAYDKTQQSSMASPHKPILIVTHSIKLKRLIEKGNIQELKNFLQNELNEGKATEVNISNF
jgi:hypothetical protein